MTTLSNARAVFLAAAIAFSVVGIATGQTFQTIEPVTGSSSTNVTGLSADGRVAVGNSNGDVISAFRWTAESGRHDLILEPGVPQRFGAMGVSGNGSVLVGLGVYTADRFQAYRWTGPGQYQALGLTGGYQYSIATDASQDGSVVVGILRDRPNFLSEVFRWTAQGGTQRIGQAGSIHSEAAAVSADGETIAGSSYYGDHESAWTWTSAGGFRFLPASPSDPSAQASGMNRDATIVVGSAGFGSSGAMWRNGVLTDLGRLEGYSNFSAVGVDDFGTVVVGTSGGGQFTNDKATIWTPSTGIMLLSDYFLAHGITLSPTTYLLSCTSVSADGLTFAGTASTDSGGRGYIVTIPAPCSGLTLIIASTLAARRRRMRL